MINISENLHTLGPFFAAVWVVTILCVLLRPQRYLNSFLLLHHTAADSYLHVRITLFMIAALTKSAKNSLVRIVPNCTCIIDDKICIF